MMKLLIFIYDSLIVNKWFSEYLTKNNLLNKKLLVYTYWFTHNTTGIGFAAKKNDNMKLISRAHGIDLYEERNKGYIPCRKYSLKLLDRLYLVSQNGKDYISKQYQEFHASYKVSGLGVKDPGFVTKPSTDGSFRVASCSGIIPAKRVKLVLSGLIVLAKKYKSIIFEWTHFGNGVLEGGIKETAKMKSPENLKCNFPGFIPNSEIFGFYRRNPVDVFVNTSRSEGGRPIAIQEALSCGIPVIGTNVGGIPEAVDDEVGILISANPTGDEIATALEYFLNNPGPALKKRRNSKIRWEKDFNATVNFKAFTKDLTELCFL